MSICSCFCSFCMCDLFCFVFCFVTMFLALLPLLWHAGAVRYHPRGGTSDASDLPVAAAVPARGEGSQEGAGSGGRGAAHRMPGKRAKLKARSAKRKLPNRKP